MFKNIKYKILATIMGFSTYSCLFIVDCDETPEHCWKRCIRAKQDGVEPSSTDCDLVCETPNDPPKLVPTAKNYDGI